MTTTAVSGAGRAAAGADVVGVSPAELERMLASGEAALVDVRQPFEHAEERIAGSRLEPLPRFDPERVRAAHGDRAVVFMCRTGKRSAAAARRFGRQRGAPAMHLSGGIMAWRAADLPVVRPAVATRVPVMRQVQLVAGSLVTLGVALGLLISPWLLAIPAFVGCGLVFAGATGWCGMASLLAAMPWNRVRAEERTSATASASSSSSGSGLVGGGGGGACCG